MSGLTWSHAPVNSDAEFDFSDEWANQITHAVAVPLTIIATVLLMQSALQNGNPRLVTGCLLYGVSLIAVYLFSTLSHSFRGGTWMHRFRTLDQIAIFALISGNFSPVGMTICQGSHLSLVLTAMWTLSAAGMLTKLFITRLENVPVWFYVLVGWLPLLTMGRVSEWFPADGLLWIVAGGVLYTLGTYFLMNDRRVSYFHAVWHLLVIAGSACHFVVIYCYLIPGLS